MSHLYIFPTMHHIPMEPHRSVFIIYQWQLIDPSSSMHHINDPFSLIGFHLTSIILIKENTYYITSIINQSILWHQSITWNQSINHWHQWQHDPTISPFGIDGNTNIDVNTNYQLLMSTCRGGILYINSQCDYLSQMWLCLPINNNHINVTISPPLTSMEKGHFRLGDAPPVWVPLIFL